MISVLFPSRLCFVSYYALCNQEMISVLFLQADYAGLEGATGFTPPVETVAAWDDPPREEEQEDELQEVRRRRLQRFSQDSRTDSNADNIDLD